MANVQETLKILLENPVLIYGAGKRGRRISVVLKELGADVVGVAVSPSMKSKTDTLGDYAVKEIGQWSDHAGKAVVLIATASDHKAIAQMCRSYGFEDLIVIYPALQDMFFSMYFKPVLVRLGVDVSGESISMGGGNYLNPFLQFERGSVFCAEGLGDFVLPPLFDEWVDIEEGPYELGEVKVSSGDIVLDIGSNHGIFSVYAASRGAESYAFEPNPALGNIIEQQSRLNNGAIRLVPYAASNVCEKTTFYVSGFAGSSSLLLSEATLEEAVESAITVDQITIDEFVKRNNISHVDFIKADIEGAERLMLEGAQETLKNHAPKLALCTYHLPDDKEVMTELILKANPNYKIEYKWKKLYAHV